MRSQDLPAIEQEVAAIWTEFLRVPDIGVDDDFFDLGGTSLALISVVMTMGERFKLPLDTSIVLEGATIGSLAAAVHRQMTERDRAEGNASRNIMVEPVAVPGG